MATSQQPPNIWAQMSYTPPRGPCSQKTSLVSTCACHRFMLHPLHAPSSYACDGCGHHASFHRMESVEDEAAVARWRAAQGRAGEERRVERSYPVEDTLRRVGDVPRGGGTKRRRITNEPEERGGGEEVVEVSDAEANTESMRTFIRERMRKGRGR